MINSIFILDKSKTVVDVLSNNGDFPQSPFFDDKYVQDLATGAETFEFTTVSNDRTSKYAVAGNYVAFKFKNKIKVFQIMQTKEEHEKALYKSCYCEIAGLELINNVIREREIPSANVRQFFEIALADTDWSLGIVDAAIVLSSNIKIERATNVYSLIQNNLSTFDIEIEYRFEMTNNKVSGMYIDVYKNRGIDSGFRFEYGQNVSGVSKQVDMSELFTAMIGVGKDNIDFKSVQWGADKPAIKPLNQDFIVDVEAHKIWNNNGSYLMGIYQSQTDSPHELLTLTWNELQKKKQPKITYDIEVNMLQGHSDEINIGDTVKVIDNDYIPALHLTARIGVLEISFTDHRQNRCILTNFKEAKSSILSLDTIQSIINGNFPIGAEQIQDGAITEGKIDTQYLHTIKTDVLVAAKVEAEELIASKAEISDLNATNAKIENLIAKDAEIENAVISNLKATTAEIESLRSKDALIENLVATKANIADLNTANANINNLEATKANITDLNATNANINILKADVAEIDTLLAGNITGENIQGGSITSNELATGTITAGSGVIADGAIGNAQISSLDAAKINAGTVDTSKVTVAGPNSNLKISGNRLQVFNGVGSKQVERVSLGDVRGDGSQYGLLVRGKDGKTVIMDENGVTNAGITDGSITNDKINPDANIDGAKININSVITRINEDGTEVIKGTKVEIDGTNLSTKLSTITTTQTTQGNKISEHSSKIAANESQINLKVDSQTYKSDKEEIETQLNKNTADIALNKEQIALKVEQTDIDKAKSEVEGKIDTKVNALKAEIKVTTDKISQNVSNLTTTVNSKADGATVSTLSNKVGSLETSLDGISGQVSSLETTTTTISSTTTNALNKANTAQDTATNAQNIANNAQGLANNAQSTANKAQTAANNAQNTANENKDNITDLQGEVTTVKSDIATLDVNLQGITQRVSSTESTTKTLTTKVTTAQSTANSAQSTANTANTQAQTNKTEISKTNTKVSTIETNLSSITSRVSNVETKQTTVDGKVSSLETRMTSAESKITESAITNTVKKNFYTKSETDSAITSKGYQTSSQVQQTVNGLQVKVSQSGGYNLIKNSTGASGNTRGWTHTGTTLGVSTNDTIGSNCRTYMYLDNGTTTSEKFAYSSRFKLKPNTKYTFVGYFHNYTACPSFDVHLLSSTSLSDTDTTTAYTTAQALISSQNTNSSWKKFTKTITTPASTRSGFIRIDNNGYNSSGTNSNRVHWNALLLVEGELEVPWSPHPSEVYDGVTTIDKDGITVSNTSSSTYTQIDSESFRVEDNKGGTVAEFSKDSIIPNLAAGIISANEVHAANIPSKAPKDTNVKYIYVNGSTGNDNNAGTSSYPLKTVQKALDMLSDVQHQSVTIYVSNSVPGFELKGTSGIGKITISLQDSAVVNGRVLIGGVTNRVSILSEAGTRKPTFKAGIAVYACVNVEIYALTFRGECSEGGNIYIRDTNYCCVNACDLGGLSTTLSCAIKVQSSLLWLHGCIGSNINDVVGQFSFSHVMMSRGGTSNVPDYKNGLLVNYDGSGRIQNWSGGNFLKTASSGWNPAYTPTSKTQTWSFNKVWSDETLNGWSDRQELIQGYASTWDTGRWTGYMQFTDGMAAIRSAINGGTNFSGRLYVQRRTSSGNSTGSKLCLYASDGTLITNSTSINRGQGVWVSLSSAVVSKIASGAITYFYLKADSNNAATFFKCESNPKIEITYTK